MPTKKDSRGGIETARWISLEEMLNLKTISYPPPAIIYKTAIDEALETLRADAKTVQDCLKGLTPQVILDMYIKHAIRPIFGTWYRWYGQELGTARIEACGMCMAHFDKTGVLVASETAVANALGIPYETVSGFISGFDSEHPYVDLDDNTCFKAGQKLGIETRKLVEPLRTAMLFANQEK